MKRNKGAPGTNGVTVEGLGPDLKAHWLTIRAQLQTTAGRAGGDTEASGGTRQLGIASVLDRFIQQAVMQVPQADRDGTFSVTSFGLPPGHAGHRPAARAQAHIASGHAIVVDCDLEKFFDRVSHDILTGLVANRVAKKHLLKLIRALPNAGVMQGGVVSPTEEGMPRGGPLSLSCQI